MAVAEEFAKRIVTFIDGKEPWSKYDKDGTALVLGENTVKEARFDEYDGRNKKIWEVIQEVGGINFPQYYLDIWQALIKASSR